MILRIQSELQANHTLNGCFAGGVRLRCIYIGNQYCAYCYKKDAAGMVLSLNYNSVWLAHSVGSKTYLWNKCIHQ